MNAPELPRAVAPPFVPGLFHDMPAAQYVARFRAKFVARPDGCWEWTASRRPNGYGQFKLGDRVGYAHRASYTLFVGAIPVGMFVCHRCDNKACVNPEHLFVGTAADNMADMAAKGRGRKTGSRGERNGRAILTAEQVVSIREALNAGAVGLRLAEAYGVGPTAISRIRSGRAWATK